MKTLILYLSHDGQTKKIAEYLARNIGNESQVAAIWDCPELSQFESIIIGASVRYGYFDKSLYKFIEKYTALLNSKPSAFFGVNLTARKAGKDSPQTNVYVRKFLHRIPWRPTISAVFAGALLYPRYHWFDRTMIRLIMKITGGETDIRKEIEYTDWDKVRHFAELVANLNK
ncbi:menaquinone-dependent protoporphyrinogen oxidase [Mesocricetibacter intestinalis]|uniref:Protoporphyrinogen IX dehydrogenase [quinone] n=1 Tax=Mesocricetibacter intestinalis TaxID=1521930 RepID=A0A4R6V788_9PAST|nr:menaquinone-dependent protoporphyrinogen IX dehydrogenase [Mesocricetibacter intestinalis]TDQ56755.1 menaquinone-dependent protoporphyrinogen oxidase [Mesocricetibacter intestinalis]